MKKITSFLLLLFKWVLLLGPAVATALWLRSAHGWPVSILAALGVILLISLLIVAIIGVAAEVRKQLKLRKEA